MEKGKMCWTNVTHNFCVLVLNEGGKRTVVIYTLSVLRILTRVNFWPFPSRDLILLHTNDGFFF